MSKNHSSDPRAAHSMTGVARIVFFVMLILCFQYYRIYPNAAKQSLDHFALLAIMTMEAFMVWRTLKKYHATTEAGNFIGFWILPIGELGLLLYYCDQDLGYMQKKYLNADFIQGFFANMGVVIADTIYQIQQIISLFLK